MYSQFELNSLQCDADMQSKRELDRSITPTNVLRVSAWCPLQDGGVSAFESDMCEESVTNVNVVRVASVKFVRAQAYIYIYVYTHIYIYTDTSFVVRMCRTHRTDKESARPESPQQLAKAACIAMLLHMIAFANPYGAKFAPPRPKHAASDVDDTRVNMQTRTRRINKQPASARTTRATTRYAMIAR